MEIIVFPAILAILLILGVIEYSSHKRNLHKIPIRIHVNGIRGKSSVTRLIGGALREAGYRTAVKTTGTSPRYIDTRGVEHPIQRQGRANIKEQLKIFKRAREEGAEAICVECMAIDPELQWVTEHRLVKSTISVITNVRYDHTDVMGERIEMIADALSGTIPKGGLVFTAEDENFSLLKRNADKLGAMIVKVEPSSVSDEEMRHFSYIEHKENVAVALAVAEHLGIDRKTALAGMYKAHPDPGALFRYEIKQFKKRITFYSIFAANDRESNIRIWRMLNLTPSKSAPVILIVNNRSDRLSRIKQFAEIIGDEITANYYILVGGFARAFGSILLSKGIPAECIFNMAGREPEEIFERILDLTARESFVCGIGNIGGEGHAIVEFFKHRSE